MDRYNTIQYHQRKRDKLWKYLYKLMLNQLFLTAYKCAVYMAQTKQHVTFIK